MAGQTVIVDWTERVTQHHWFKVRHLLEHEIQSATEQARRDYDIRVRVNSAAIVTLDGVDYLWVPISAIWRQELEQAIAAILVSRPVDDDARAVAIGVQVRMLLERWIEREVPVDAAPMIFYPETETRWPAEPEPVAAKPAVAKPAPGEAPASAGAAEAQPTVPPPAQPKAQAAAEAPAAGAETIPAVERTSDAARAAEEAAGAQPPLSAEAVASNVGAKATDKPMAADSTGTEQESASPPRGGNPPPVEDPAAAAAAGIRGQADATLDKTDVPRVRAENPAAAGSSEAPANAAEAAAGAEAMREIIEPGAPTMAEGNAAGASSTPVHEDPAGTSPPAPGS